MRLSMHETQGSFFVFHNDNALNQILHRYHANIKILPKILSSYLKWLEQGYNGEQNLRSGLTTL